MPAVPHLLAIINLTALTKGVLPLHATAFSTASAAGSMGVLVAGWSKGGKTETLLACMSEGARYVGDEWVFLTPDGRMHGLPEPIRLWSWQLEQMPALLGARPARDRRRLAAWKNIARVAERTARSGLPGAGIVRRAARLQRAPKPALRRRLHGAAVAAPQAARRHLHERGQRRQRVAEHARLVVGPLFGEQSTDVAERPRLLLDELAAAQREPLEVHAVELAAEQRAQALVHDRLHKRADA